MRVHEAQNIRVNAEIMATAALARSETRTCSAHRRLDYPEADNENWQRFVIVEQGADGRPAVTTLDASEPLSAVFGRSSQSQTMRRPAHVAGA